MFVSYLIWSLEILISLPPICYFTPVIIVAVLASIFIQKPFGREIWKRRYSVAILQFVFFPATLLVATIGPNGVEQNTWGLRATNVLAFISLGVGIYWIWLMKGLRWFATSVAILQFWLLAAANFIAGMALTGRWL